nr:hypothetical protein GCM10017745_36840 [Saccharothrix mutabilis subsp. capreolus]
MPGGGCGFSVGCAGQIIRPCCSRTSRSPGFLEQQDDLAVAAVEYNALTDAYARTLEPEHRYTLDVRHARAVVLGRLGDLAAGEAELQDVLAIGDGCSVTIIPTRSAVRRSLGAGAGVRGRGGSVGASGLRYDLSQQVPTQEPNTTRCLCLHTSRHPTDSGR